MYRRPVAVSFLMNTTSAMMAYSKFEDAMMQKQEAHGGGLYSRRCRNYGGWSPFSIPVRLDIAQGSLQ
jgi:hypothetical protein